MVNCWDVCLTTRFLIAISTGHRERATSHKRLRARDYYTSSTLIGGKGEACPSSVHTMLKGPTEYVNARWDVKSTWIPTWRLLDHVSCSLGSCFMLTWIMFHAHLDYFQEPSLGGRSNTKNGDHGTPNAVDLFYFIICEDPHE